MGTARHPGPREEPLRFSELVHNIGGISERMASQTLKYLEQIGVVRREVLQRSKRRRSIMS